MNINKTIIAIILFSSTQLAFSKSSVEPINQKDQQQNIEIMRKYAIENNKNNSLIFFKFILAKYDLLIIYLLGTG